MGEGIIRINEEGDEKQTPRRDPLVYISLWCCLVLHQRNPAFVASQNFRDAKTELIPYLDHFPLGNLLIVDFHEQGRIAAFVELDHHSRDETENAVDLKVFRGQCHRHARVDAEQTLPKVYFGRIGGRMPLLSIRRHSFGLDAQGCDFGLSDCPTGKLKRICDNF